MASVIRGSDNFDTADTGGGKALCTAWVNFDGTTTPPTIRDSYNVSSVVRTSTGQYDVYFATPMDNVNYVVSGGLSFTPTINSGVYMGIDGTSNMLLNKFRLKTGSYDGGYYSCVGSTIQIFGGRN